jgi:hypothetical protein
MKRVFIALLFCLFALPAFSSIHDVELILQDTSISIKNGRMIKHIRYDIRINNRAGEKHTKVNIPYSKIIKVSKIEAGIKDTNGMIIKKVQKNEIIEKSAISDFSLYEDDYIKEFTLKHNSYPYIISYSYEEEQEEFLLIDYWMPVIDWNTPTIKAVLRLDIPKGFRISYRDKLTDSFKCDSNDLSVNYIWTASYTNQVEPQTSSPEINTFLPSVKIVPVEFKYDLPGSLRSWSEFGDWQSALNRGLSDLPQTEKYVINELIKGITDTKQKVKILYQYLQDHTRYINITIETGGMKPYPASYVSVNKYGDCKALSNYFKSILECADIKSYYTKVHAGDIVTDVDKSFPSQQFNHIILCVPVTNDTLWLDCTSDMAFGYLGTFTQARDVFIIDEGKSYFTHTPELTIEDVIETRKVTFQQKQNETLAEFSITYGGDNYENYYSLYSQATETDRDQIFRNNIVKNGFELINFKMLQPARDSAKISTTYTALSNRIYKDYGNDMIIALLPFPVPRFEDPKKRKLPVQLDYPIYRVDSLEYEIPPDYRVASKFTNQLITSEFGNYKCDAVIKDKKIFVIKSFTLFSGRYTVDKYQGFYEFLSKVIDIESNNLIVTNKIF